jgi:4-alpha-glucanotransferase
LKTNIVVWVCILELSAGETLAEEYGIVGRNDPAGRLAGIVLHPTSLVGAYGTGDLGRACYSFIDWLASAGMKVWQVLPLVPPDEDYFCPYSGQDALCGNPLLISLEALVEKGLLEKGVVLG